METAAALPDDMLAGIFGRLPARSLAASRGTCKAWRDLIDERQLLVRLQRLLPHTVHGLFINYQEHNRCHFLSRPTPTSSPEYDGLQRIDGKFDFVDKSHHSWYKVVDHGNGLVLLLETGIEVLHICNPTTQWSVRLPPWPGAPDFDFDYDAWNWGHRAFLMLDPLVSPEYKVLLSPAEPGTVQMLNNDACRLMEWPPSSWYEFSSSTGIWEEKVFLRDGEAAGTAGDLLLDEDLDVEPPCRYGAYWKGALYIHWRGDFITRLSLQDGKYRLIKSRIQLADGESHAVQSFIGRSEKGIHIAAITCKAVAKLQVWTLNESGGRMEWVPRHQSNLKINASSWRMENNKFDELKYWILDHDDRKKNQQVPQNVCWNSDHDNIVDVSNDKQNYFSNDNKYHKPNYLPYVTFLGFHPYKEVIFLCTGGSIMLWLFI